MPSTLPTVTRRRVLVGGAALVLLSGALATACSSTPAVKSPDPLLGPLDRARRDSTLAGNAAAAAPPKLATILTVIAQQRAAHAKALTEEITRASGEPPPSPSTSATTASAATTSPVASPSAPAPPPPTAADVLSALKQSADDATQLTPQQSGYRAGLMGSIAAACTAAVTVALAPGSAS